MHSKADSALLASGKSYRAADLLMQRNCCAFTQLYAPEEALIDCRQRCLLTDLPCLQHLYQQLMIIATWQMSGVSMKCCVYAVSLAR